MSLPQRLILTSALLLLAGWGGVIQAGELRMNLTNNGQALERPDMIKFYVYPPDKRERHEAWGHADRRARVPDGEYDVVVRFEAGFVVRTKTFEKMEIVGNVTKAVDFGIPLARLTLQMAQGDRFLPKNSSRVSIYNPGERGKPIGRSRPGERMEMRPGSYDVELTWMTAEGSLESRWLTDFPVQGEMVETVSVGEPPALLKFTLKDRGRLVAPDQGVWRIFRPGDRTTPLMERGSGLIASVDQGTYDVELRLLTTDPPRIEWLEGVEVNGELARDIDMRPATFLQVDARLRDGGTPPGGRFWYSVYAVGERRTPLATARGGESLPLEPGRYDVGVFFRDRQFEAQTWLERQRVDGETRLSVAVDFKPAYLTVNPPQRRRRRDRTDPMQPRLMILLDRGAGMGRAAADGTRWIDWVRETLGELLPSIQPEMPIGLRTYGGTADRTDACSVTASPVPVDSANREALISALGNADPSGESALVEGLRGLSADSAGPGTSLLILTNNAGTCAGDPCDTAGRLLRDGRFGRSFVVGLGMSQGTQDRMACLGAVSTATNRQELRAALLNVLRRVSKPEDGTVAVFEAGPGGRYVAGGAFGDRISLTEGRYDVVMFELGESYRWDNFRIRGDERQEAGRRPR